MHSRSTRSRLSSESRGSPAPREADYYNGKESPILGQNRDRQKLDGKDRRGYGREDQSSPIMNQSSYVNGYGGGMRYGRGERANHARDSGYRGTRGSAMDDPTGYRGGGARMDQDPSEFPTGNIHRDGRNGNGLGHRDRRPKEKERRKEMELYSRRSGDGYSSNPGPRDSFDGLQRDEPVRQNRDQGRMDLGRSRLSAEGTRHRRPEYSP